MYLKRINMRRLFESSLDEEISEGIPKQSKGIYLDLYLFSLIIYNKTYLSRHYFGFFSNLENFYESFFDITVQC